MSKRPLLVSGYPRWTIDLFVETTNALYSVFDSLLGNLPEHIISGCALTSAGGGLYNVAPGLVFASGKVRRFAGATNVALPFQFLPPTTPTPTDSRPLYAGGTAYTAEDHSAVLGLGGGLTALLIIDPAVRPNFIYALKAALGWDSKASTAALNALQAQLNQLKLGAWHNLDINAACGATVPAGRTGPQVARTGGTAPLSTDAVQVHLRGEFTVGPPPGGGSPPPMPYIFALPADCRPAADVHLRLPLGSDYFNGVGLSQYISVDVTISAATGQFEIGDPLGYPYEAPIRLDGVSFWRQA